MELVNIFCSRYFNELFVSFWIILANNYFSSESEEDANADTKTMNKLEPISDIDDDERTKRSKPLLIQVDENDQSSEEKQNVFEALTLTQKLDQLNDQNIKDDTDDDVDDDEVNVASIVNNDYRRILRDDDDEDEN